MRAPALVLLALLVAAPGVLLGPAREGSKAPGASPRPTGPAAPAPLLAPAPAQTEPIAQTLPPSLPETFSPGILAHWQGRLLTPLRTRAPGPSDDFHLPIEFPFPLNASASVPVRVHRFDVTGPDAGVFYGEVADQPGSTVILSFVGLAQAGVVHLPAIARSYVVQGDDQGRIRITENDLKAAPGCTAPLVPPHG